MLLQRVVLDLWDRLHLERKILDSLGIWLTGLSRILKRQRFNWICAGRTSKNNLFIFSILTETIFKSFARAKNERKEKESSVLILSILFIFSISFTILSLNFLLFFILSLSLLSSIIINFTTLSSSEIISSSDFPRVSLVEN